MAARGEPKHSSRLPLPIPGMGAYIRLLALGVVAGFIAWWWMGGCYKARLTAGLRVERIRRGFGHSVGVGGVQDLGGLDCCNILLQLQQHANLSP